MKLMIVDDHAGVRNIIRQLLNAPDANFIECATGEEAVRVARDFQPDFVTMDVRLPGVGGLEAARAIRAFHPSCRIVIVSSYDQPVLRQIAGELGAIAYVLKDNLSELRSLLVDGAIPPPRSDSTGGHALNSAQTSDRANAPGDASAVQSDRMPEAGLKPNGPIPCPCGGGRALRLLMVEDDRNDCELILRQLRRCGFAPQVKQVDSGPALRRALDHDFWDVIITDHKLPAFSGAEALALIHATGLNIPTLCVTGSADPAKIREVLNAGACALISKDDLSPLCAAVARALDRRTGRSDWPGRSNIG